MVLGKHFIERAQRHKIELGAPVTITATANSAARKESYLTLRGQMLDLSLSGVALIISYYDMRELKRLQNDWMMRLLLPLPKKTIEMEAVPARYQRLDETVLSRILLGARITNITGNDRIVLTEFIRQCETSGKA